MTTCSELNAFIILPAGRVSLLQGTFCFSTVHLPGFTLEQKEYSAVPSGQVRSMHAKNSRRQTEINEKVSRLLYKHREK